MRGSEKESEAVCIRPTEWARKAEKEQEWLLPVPLFGAQNDDPGSSVKMKTGRVSVPRSLWLRLVLGPILLAALVPVARHARLFYADVAPFHQMYWFATPAQDAAVTKRLVMAHFAFPGLVLALLLVLAPSFVLRNARRSTRIFGFFFLLGGLQGCATVARLPYGFGSGYEHANAAQHYHLALAGWTGILGIGIAVLLFVVSFVLPYPSRQRE